MSDFVRVTVKATGGQTSLHRSTVEAEPDLYEVLEKPAVDASGVPLPGKPNKSPAPKKGAVSSRPSKSETTKE